MIKFNKVNAKAQRVINIRSFLSMKISFYHTSAKRSHTIMLLQEVIEFTHMILFPKKKLNQSNPQKKVCINQSISLFYFPFLIAWNQKNGR